jgi:hypothetical protein
VLLRESQSFFFAQQENNKYEDEEIMDGIQVSFSVNVMKHSCDENLEFFYRHDLNSYFIQSVCKEYN